MSSLWTNVREEYNSSIAFKMASIGAILTILSIIIVAISVSIKIKSLSLVIPVLLNLLFVVLYLGFFLYVIYCIINGRCEILAAVEGSLMLVFGIAAFIVAILVPFGKLSVDVKWK